ncbi:hypothetical protein OROMI_001923 [Orobanche minor]
MVCALKDFTGKKQEGWRRNQSNSKNIQSIEDNTNDDQHIKISPDSTRYT